MTRPRRVLLPDFAGRPCTLPDGPEAWIRGGAGSTLLVFGLGPARPWELPFLAGERSVLWLDSPTTLAALRPFRPSCPPHWRQVSPEDAAALAPHCRWLFYRAGPRLDPAFWCPLLGRLDAIQDAMDDTMQDALPRHAAARPGAHRSVLLPGANTLLLHRELRTALAQCRFTPVGEELRGLRAWRHCLTQTAPAFVLAVNLRGLDAEGRVFHLCRALGVPVAIWFVDNPWHLLSAARLPWWREAALFVTDTRFTESLRAHGARQVAHLPLAVAPHMWQAQGAAEARVHAGQPLFVGSSAFPGRERFFAAARVPPALEEEAHALLRRSTRPDDAPHFFWWREKLGGALWPGHAVRRMGLGAELCSAANRQRWLLAAGAGRPGGIRVAGDDGWKRLLPNVTVRPPVDYYTQLPRCYAEAGAVLHITSLLLPASLSQRHFDVWASGGLLLSDATRGLDIFPRELTEPVTLRNPEAAAATCARLCAQPARTRELRRAWQEHLRLAHGYEHRIRRICEVLGIDF